MMTNKERTANMYNCYTTLILSTKTQNSINNYLFRSDFKEVFYFCFLQNYKNSCGVNSFVLAYLKIKKN